MPSRRRSRRVLTRHDRLLSFAKRVRDRALLLPPADQQDVLLEKARQADAAVRMNNWANSPGLRPPK
jgi:hypothetical protein